ncbi:MAG: rRNA adenine dimethyltransferase family protein [Planctomycetota bacterium]
MTVPDHPPRNASELRALLESADLRLRKNLGQSFLVDRNLRDALVRDAGVGEGDLVLEIGVGLGVLTEGLLDSGARVIGVELDEGMLAATSQLLAAHLPPVPGNGNGNGTTTFVPDAGHRLRLIRANALDRKVLAPDVVHALDAAREAVAAPGRLLLVANLPYNIASTVLVAALEWRSAHSGRGIDGYSVLVQLEVAQRLVAPPGTTDYGALTVLVSSQADSKLARRVPNSVFVPRPRVDSGFVTGITTHAASPAPFGLSVAQYDHMRRVVHATFQYRRKKLARALEFGLQRPIEEIRDAIAGIGLSIDIRGELLTPAQFAQLSVALPELPQQQ